MISAGAEQLTRIRSAHPEWHPWLSLVEQTAQAAGDRRWEQVLPAAPGRRSGAPLLAHAELDLPGKLLEGWLDLLLAAAARAGTTELATLRRGAESRREALEWLCAALASDNSRLERIAARIGADRGALRSVAQLLPIPLLQACRRAWVAPENAFWLHSYCPLCGAWPAFAEVRGIERTRYLCCARCGEQWPAHAMRCVFCGLDDHEKLVTLMSDNPGPPRAVEACKDCGGYLKCMTVLQAGAAERVLLDDLATVELDIAAIEQGFHRPEGLGYRIDPRLTCSKNGAGASFFRRS